VRFQNVRINLNGGHSRRQHQPLVISVNHDHCADGPGGQAPAVLPGELALARFLRVLKADVEHFGEVLAQVVRSAALKM
jgi:hypothetical protein